MERTAKVVKEKLDAIIRAMGGNPSLFAKNPSADFTRKRKLSFEGVLRILLGMGGGSIQTELLKQSDYSPQTATSSAFIQQRSKLLPIALEFLHHEFTMSFSDMQLHQGYRLLAIDGSDFHPPANPNEPDNYFQNHPGEKGYSLFHLNALYDLCNHVYTDALIQNRRESNEHRALVSLVDRSRLAGRTILLADRGFESYNNLAHIERKGWNYLIRIKDVHSNGILSGLRIPDAQEFDLDIQFMLTRKQTKLAKSQKDCRFLPCNVTFDFLDLQHDLFYPIRFRVVRFMLSDGRYEAVITNLDRDSFPPDALKNLYNTRWGIETAFRHLKYALGLSAFHSKKMAFIVQEVFARLIMFNFSALIVSNLVIRQKPNHLYQVNFSIAVSICRHFFRSALLLHPPDIEALIAKHILPIRPGRSAPRAVRHKSAVCFQYRLP